MEALSYRAGRVIGQGRFAGIGLVGGGMKIAIKWATLATLFLLAACAFPMRDPSRLAAIKAESRLLMATKWPKSVVPRDRWPKMIASLEPDLAMVPPNGVDIIVKMHLDGGWGYYAPLSSRARLEPEGRFSDLGRGVYWRHPY